MKTNGLKVGKKIIAAFICVLILFGNINLILPVSYNNYLSEYVEKQEIERTEILAIIDNKNETIGSRSGIREEKVEFTIYKLIIEDEAEFYLDSLDLAENKKEYILNNIKDKNVYIEELKQDNNDNLSNVEEMNMVIEKMITDYKESLTCYPTSSHYVSSSYGNRKRRRFSYWNSFGWKLW